MSKKNEPRFIIAVNMHGGQVAPAWVCKVMRSGGYGITRNKENARVFSAGIVEGALIVCRGAANAARHELVAVPA